MPGYSLLEEHNIKHINTTESNIPLELKQGTICIGTNTYKGKITKAYLSNDIEYRNLSLVLVAPTRSGKSTLIENIANDEEITFKIIDCTDYYEYYIKITFFN
mgnify:CR=1 FL=1